MDQAGIATLAVIVVLVAAGVGTIGTPLIVDAVDVQPDSPLYSLERAGESIRGVFAGGQDWEIERARERCNEFVYMVDVGNASEYTWLVEEANNHLLETAKLADDNEGLQRAIEANVFHLVLLENVKERVPAEVKPTIIFAQLQSYASVGVLENVAKGVHLKIPEPLKVELDNRLSQIRVAIENLRIENITIRIENYGKLRLEVENAYAISVIENLHVIWEPKPVENIEIKLLKSLRIEPANAWISVGDFCRFTATAVYSDGSTEDVTCVATWGLSNPAIGKLVIVYTLCLDHPCYASFHAEKIGYTWITANYHGYSDSIPVVVSESPPPTAFGELKLAAFSDEEKIIYHILENYEIENPEIEYPYSHYRVNVGGAVTVGDTTAVFLGNVYVYYKEAHGIKKGDNLTGFGALYYEPHAYIDAFSDGFWISKFSISIENIIVTPENLENAIIIMEKIWLENLDKVENIAVSLAGPTPDHWDWRSRKGGDWATPVRYQGSCGSCWAFGAIASVESCVNIKADDPDLDMNLSEQYLLSCSPGGCDGWYLSCTLDWMKEHGAILESCFPYRADDTTPCAEKCTNWERKLVKVQDWHWVKSDKESIKNALIRHGPLPTCMLIYKDFFRYKGGIYRHVSEDILGAHAHAVTIVGYDDRNEYWICKNSWGVDWGESGWFKIGYGECQIEERTAYLDVVITPSYSFGNDYVVVDSDAATEPSEVIHIYYVDIPLAVDSFMVEICDGDELTVEVYDPDGNLVENKQGFADDAWNSLDISSSLPGTYMVKIYDQHDYWWSYGNGYRLDVTTTSDANLRLYSYHTCLDQGDGSAEVWVEVPQGTSFFTLSNYDMDDKGKLTIYRPDGTIYGVYGDPNVISGNEEWERLSINSAEYPGFWELHFSDLRGAKAFLVEVGTLVSTSEGPIVVETSENFEITIGENVAWDPVMEAHFYSLLKLHHKSVPLPEE